MSDTDKHCDCVSCDAERLLLFSAGKVGTRAAFGDEFSALFDKVINNEDTPAENRPLLYDLDTTIADLRATVATVVVSAIIGDTPAATRGTKLVHDLTDKIIAHSESLARAARHGETLRWMHDAEKEDSDGPKT